MFRSIRRGPTALGFVAALAACGQSRDASPLLSAQEDPFTAFDFAGPRPGECPAATAARCNETWATILSLRAQRDSAIAARDATALGALALELDKQAEILDHLRGGDTDPQIFANLDSKYTQLQELLAATRINNLIYRQAELAEVAKVTRDYGPLYITESAPVDGAPGFEEVSVYKPWAGYWYPFRSTELFDGADSPLGKLDKVLIKLGRPGNTAAAERLRSSLPDADAWEGRCPAWAVASVMSLEPMARVTYKDITFSPADQKALLLLAHERYPTRSYGIRYLGNAETDGTFQSLRPEAFHRIFTTELGQNQRAIIVNDDAGVEVWNRPVYRVRWTIRKDPAVDSAYKVTAMPDLIRSRTAVNGQATSDADRYAPLYEYRLFVDPAQSIDGHFKVIAGEWLGSSQRTHPHYVIVPDRRGTFQANSDDFNRAMDVVKQIVNLR